MIRLFIYESYRHCILQTIDKISRSVNRVNNPVKLLLQLCFRFLCDHPGTRHQLLKPIDQFLFYLLINRCNKITLSLFFD